jgi:hypothetical protein
MVLTPMRQQGFVGISASPAPAFQFFQRPLKVVSEQSLETSVSIHKDLDRALVGRKQLVAGFAGHVAMTDPGNCFTKSACSSGELPGLLRIRVLEGV